MSNYKIMALGGLEENGKNCYIYETENDIIIIDLGYSNFINNMFGIDHVVADISYLMENEFKIRAMLISHGHLDQMGGINTLLEKINVPIYGSNYTISFLKGYIKKGKYKFLNEIKYNKVLQLGEVKVETFRLSHAIFGNLGFLLNYKDEAVVYATDYNFDQIASKFARTDIPKIVSLASKYNIKALMSESVAANKKGSAASFQNILVQFKRQLENAHGRTVISIYSSNLAGMNNIIDLASELGKKIVIIGRDLLTYVNVAKEYGYIEPRKDLFIRISEISKYDDSDLIIVIADMHAKLFMELEKIAKLQHKILSFKDTDTLIVASKPNDEVEALAQKVMDSVSRAGVKIINQKINVASHAHEEDLKMMINLFSPEMLIPIKGEYRKFEAFRKIGQQLGYDLENIKLLQNGEQLEFFDNAAIITNKIKLEDILLKSKTAEKINPILLKDRETLAENGYLIVVVSVYKKTTEYAQEPQIIFPDNLNIDQKIIDGCVAVVKKEIAKDYSMREVINKIKIKVSRFIQNKTGKPMMVLPMKIEIDQKYK